MATFVNKHLFHLKAKGLSGFQATKHLEDFEK